jgi:hypothetical protein
MKKYLIILIASLISLSVQAQLGDTILMLLEHMDMEDL